MKIAVITGASSGLGREFAIQLDKQLKNVDEIWLIARRKERLEDLSRLLHNRTKIFKMDLTNRDTMKQFSEILSITNPQICMLVNSAGYGIMGKVENLSLEEQIGMIQCNCQALTEMTHRCLPYMKKGGRIIQIASAAAFLPQANFAVYAATKSYVLSFSRALNEELSDRKISVTAVCPGPVDTEFFSIAEKYGKTLSIKKMTMVKAKQVVTLAIRDSYYRKAVSVCGIPMKGVLVLAKCLPHSWLLFFMNLLK